MQQPEAYVGGAASLFDAEGKLTNEKTCAFLVAFMAAYSSWVDAHRKR
jgi:chromate reductase